MVQHSLFDDNEYILMTITFLFRMMNPKMKTIKKQFRWNFVVVTRDNGLQHGDGVRTQGAQQFNQKNKTFYLMSRRTVLQNPEKSAILTEFVLFVSKRLKSMVL